MMVGVQMAVLGGAHPGPDTLLSSCGANPGVTCQLVWDLSHNRHASAISSEFLSGPVHLLLRVVFVVALALVIQAIVHRVINRLTERAALLPSSAAAQRRGRGPARARAAGRATAARQGSGGGGRRMTPPPWARRRPGAP